MAHQMLGSKHHEDNSKFSYAWNNIESIISREEISDIVVKTVEDIRNVVSGRRAAYAWSGGKDSLVIQYLCNKAGIVNGVLAIASKLTFPDVLKWLKLNTPKGVQTYDFKQYDIPFLAKHLELLFPYPSKNKWAQIVQIRAQERYAKENDIEVMLYGRRTQDGNFCGRGNNTYFKDGVLQYNPIASWRHEHVMAVIHYFMNRNILPTYYYRDGWVLSAEIWPNLIKTPDKNEGWQRIYEIDQTLVYDAAKYIQSAQQFIRSKK